MDAIIRLVLMLVSAWLAYAAVASERRPRAWSGTASIGVFLAVFGAASLGLTNLWDSFLRPKLVNDFPSEGTLLFIGLLTVAWLVVLALDLLGVIDIMSKARASMERANTSRPAAPGGDHL